MDALNTLMDTGQLEPHDHEIALRNTREAFENLQQSYRDARTDHDLLRRRHGSNAGHPFDEDKEIDGI